MQKDVREIMNDIARIDKLQTVIAEEESLDIYKNDVATILDEYLDILLNAKVKIG